MNVHEMPLGADPAVSMTELQQMLSRAQWAVKAGTTYVRLSPGARVVAIAGSIAVPSALVASIALHMTRNHRAANIAALIGVGGAVVAAATIIPTWTRERR